MPRIRRLFVVGVPRSGTTLLQSLLAAHSTMTSFTESHFFDRHFSHLPLLPAPILTRDPSPRVREFLAENEELPPEAALWFTGSGRWALAARTLLPLQTRPVARRLLEVLDQLAGRRRRAGWIEKTPRHLRYIPLIEAVSEARDQTSFVHVIRQGLEVVASLHEASRGWERSYDLETCIRRWNADVGLSLSRVSSPRDHFVFYEELTSRPETTLRRLLSALRLAWEPSLLEGYAAASESLITGEEAWKADVGRRIRPSGTSERSLTAAQRERVLGALRPGLYEELRERAGRRLEEEPAAP